MIDAAAVSFQKAVKISHISVTQFEAWLDTQMPFFDIHVFPFSRIQTAEIKHFTSLHTVFSWVTKATTAITCKCFTWLNSTSTQHRNFVLPTVLSYCRQSINSFITQCTCWSVHLYCWIQVPAEIILWTLQPQQQETLV
jgi:hypothetical protein